MVIAQTAQVVQLADGSHHSADVFLIHRDARCVLKLGNAPSDQLLATHVHFLNVAVGLLPGSFQQPVCLRSADPPLASRVFDTGCVAVAFQGQLLELVDPPGSFFV